MKKHLLPPVALTITLLSAAIHGSSDAAEFLALGPGLLGTGQGVQAISPDGSVFVGGGFGVGDNVPGFFWNRTTGFQFLDSPPDSVDPNKTPQPSGVSAQGDVIVGTYGASSYRWTRGFGVEEIDSPIPLETVRDMHVSADGAVIAGWASLDPGFMTFRWTEDQGLLDIGKLVGIQNTRSSAISGDGNVIVGFSSHSFGGIEAFRWTEETGIVGRGDLPGGDFWSEAIATSWDGSVVVGYGSPTSDHVGREPFRWTEEEGMVGLGHLPGGVETYPTSVSSDGSLVVGYSGLPGSDIPGNYAFIWDEMNGMRPLGDFLRNDVGFADQLEGWSFRTATAMISADGKTLAGRATNPHGEREYWVASLLPDLAADFDGDGDLDGDDIDALVSEIVVRTNDLAFDVSGDGLVDPIDLTQWLVDAATANGFASPYLFGDANLDGTVNAADLNKLGQNWLASPSTWQWGDFTADGVVNAEDLNHVGQNWLKSVPSAGSTSAVPEPVTNLLITSGAMCAILVRRRPRRKSRETHARARRGSPDPAA